MRISEAIIAGALLALGCQQAAWAQEAAGQRVPVPPRPIPGVALPEPDSHGLATAQPLGPGRGPIASAPSGAAAHAALPIAPFSSARDALKAWMRGASPLPVHSINAPPALVGVDFSDHLSYWAHGYPALMVTDTAFFRNAAYHEASDTAERLDYRRMAQVVQGVASFALQPAGP